MLHINWPFLVGWLEVYAKAREGKEICDAAPYPFQSRKHWAGATFCRISAARLFQRLAIAQASLNRLP